MIKPTLVIALKNIIIALKNIGYCYEKQPFPNPGTCNSLLLIQFFILFLVRLIGEELIRALAITSLGSMN